MIFIIALVIVLMVGWIISGKEEQIHLEDETVRELLRGNGHGVRRYNNHTNRWED